MQWVPLSTGVPPSSGVALSTGDPLSPNGNPPYITAAPMKTSSSLASRGLGPTSLTGASIAASVVVTPEVSPPHPLVAAIALAPRA
jgi:hypothetical protein